MYVFEGLLKVLPSDKLGLQFNSSKLHKMVVDISAGLNKMPSMHLSTASFVISTPTRKIPLYQEQGCK